MHTTGTRNFGNSFNSQGGNGDVAFSGPGAYPSQAFASGSHTSAYEDAVRATSFLDQSLASIGGGSFNSLGSAGRLQRAGESKSSDHPDELFGASSFNSTGRNGHSLEKKNSLLVSNLDLDRLGNRELLNID